MLLTILLVKKISKYLDTILNFLSTILGSSSKAFREVVLIEYPRKNLWAIAFITSETKGEISNKLKGKCVNVFLPTTPNPTSGFMLVVPVKSVIRLKMNIEEGMKLVI